MTESAPEAMPTELGVKSEDGGDVALRALWQDGPVVLAFVRHFGWLLCQEQVAQLRDVKDEIESLGAKLLVVGNGSPTQARMFGEDQNLIGAVYTDPTRAVYRALGMKDGIKNALKLDALKNAWRAYRAGYRQTSVQGDPLQQGGVLVVDRSGSIAYAYLSETAGDHPPVDEVLGALRELSKK